jgi:hypothetical protein
MVLQMRTEGYVSACMTRMRIRLAGPVFALALLWGFVTAGTVAGLQARSAGTISPISESLCEEMKVRHVLNPGAPVDCGRLRLIRFNYIDFNGQLQDDGEIIVMDAAARYVLEIFDTLRRIRFPIAKARLMNHYDGNDDASMADNNTSSFNVRGLAERDALSLHAYGLAIDINPLQNPFVKRSGATLTFSPPMGVEYANRSNDRPGKPNRSGMVEGVVDVFADNGFLIWGGYWDDPIDYQHFQVSRKVATQLLGLPPDQAELAFAKYVQRYRSCRRAAPHGPAGRVKCVLGVGDIDDGN